VGKPYVLMVLDGWGEKESSRFNAINTAHTPTWHYLKEHYPHGIISGSGEDVGLPQGQMGNSEVGHMNLGAGRIVYQELTRIDKSIHDGSFFNQATLIQAIEVAKKKHSQIHVMGLLSPGGVHSHESHIMALLTLCQRQNFNRVVVHAFLDGRDTPPKSAKASLDLLEHTLTQTGVGEIGTIGGRYYAMDRDKRWDRVEKAYALLTEGRTEHTYDNAAAALQAAYDAGVTDEFVIPCALAAKKLKTHLVQDDDVIIFMNFRSDRARQLTRSFIDPNFSEFTHQKKIHLAAFVSLTEYAADLKTEVVFPPSSLKNGLGEYFAQLGLTQLRVAETEKYAHVTFFFNGGIETPFPKEDRILIASPHVATYDLAPEMSAPAVADAIVDSIMHNKHDVIICNFANADMVGHTGDFDAAVKAIECLDACLGRIIAALKEKDGEALITADHGNAECMFDEAHNQAHTAHTQEPVPLVYFGKAGRLDCKNGVLADVAPTLLHIMNLPIPKEMTGKSLLKR